MEEKHYYDHLCPCGNRIEVKPYHKKSGKIPKACKSGHSGLAKKNRKLNSRFDESYRLYIPGEIYLCICGCKKEIKFKKHYQYTGFPQYISGHNSHPYPEEAKRKLSLLRKGVPRPEDVVAKMSIAIKEGMNNPEVRKKLSDSKIGTTHTEETKRKISLALSGDKCHLWNGGTSFEPYSPDFNRRLKADIRKRDNYTCQECKWTEHQLDHKLDIHHIDYVKKHNTSCNLISLCRPCHSKTNYKRECWQNYFTEKFKEILNAPINS